MVNQAYDEIFVSKGSYAGIDDRSSFYPTGAASALVKARFDGTMRCFYEYMRLNLEENLELRGGACICAAGKHYDHYKLPEIIDEWRDEFPKLAEEHPQEKDINPKLVRKVFIRFSYHIEDKNGEHVRSLNEPEEEFLDACITSHGYRKFEKG